MTSSSFYVSNKEATVIDISETFEYCGFRGIFFQRRLKETSGTEDNLYEIPLNNDDSILGSYFSF